MPCNIDWLAFLVAMAVVELTPGPNMGWLTALSAQKGRRTGFMAVLGITLGLAVQLVAAATGISAIVSANPAIYHTLRWGGVAFMLYLAWEAFADGGEKAVGEADHMAGFRRGFIANLLNPKALVFYVAVVGQFATCEQWPVAGQVLILGSLHIAVAIAVHVLLVLLGSGLGEKISQWRQAIGVRIGFAAALASIALWIAISTHPG